MKSTTVLLFVIIVNVGWVSAASHINTTIEPILEGSYQHAESEPLTGTKVLKQKDKGILFYLSWVKNKFKNTLKKWLGIDQKEGNGNGLLVGWIMSGLSSIIFFILGASAASHLLSALLALVFYPLGILLAILTIILFALWADKVKPN